MKKSFLFFILVLLLNTAQAQITIDGDFSDWAGVPVLIDDPTGDGSNGWDIDNVYVTDDASNVYFRIQMASSVAGSKTLYFLISVDPQNEPTTRTGLSYGWWDNGYDFLIQYDPQDNTLYRHTGNGDGWTWENGGTNSQMWKQNGGNNDYSDIEIAVSKADLDNPNIAGWTNNTQTQIAVMTFVDDGSFGEEAGSGTNHGGVVYDLTNGPLPVELISFNSKLIGDNGVELTWKTATENDNYGFEVERKVYSEKFTNGSWEKIGFVKGYGNSNSPKQYKFVDKNLAGGNNFAYRLKQIDTDGSFRYVGEVKLKVITNEYKLNQNYPNPFNPETTIAFTLPKKDYVKLVVYNLDGEIVKTLIDGIIPAGFHNVKFNAGSLASGIYLFKLETLNFTQTKKMILLK